MKSDKPDPLAKFRRPLIETAAIKDSKTYAAFGGKDRVERLRIYRALAPTYSPRYLHLQNMAFDGHFGLTLTLYYDFMIVLVRGKNLQGMVAAIETSSVDFIQEYHPEIWEKPADDAPIIESIEVVVPGDSENPEPSSGEPKH